MSSSGSGVQGHGKSLVVRWRGGSAPGVGDARYRRQPVLSLCTLKRACSCFPARALPVTRALELVGHRIAAAGQGLGGRGREGAMRTSATSTDSAGMSRSMGCVDGADAACPCSFMSRCTGMELHARRSCCSGCAAACATGRRRSTCSCCTLTSGGNTLLRAVRRRPAAQQARHQQPRPSIAFHARLQTNVRIPILTSAARECHPPSGRALQFDAGPGMMPPFAREEPAMPRRIAARRSPIHGNGVFAIAPIAKGETVIQYKGRLITHSPGRPRIRRRRRHRSHLPVHAQRQLHRRRQRRTATPRAGSTTAAIPTARP